MAPSTRVMLSLHELDADPYAGPYRCIRRQCLAWLLRFLQFPVVMPRVFYTTLIFVLCFLCLPWFRAEFIPSGDSAADGGRYGTFYLWGFVFGNNEWLPLGDSFMFAVFHLCFDVGVFLILFAWRATDIEDLHCPTVADGGLLQGHHQQQQQQQWNRALWFKILEVVYWVWRMSSVMAIGSFYGWPALMLNSLVLWMLFAAGVLVWGKDGLMNYRSTKGRSRIHTALEGCPHCQTLSSGTTLAAAPSLSLYSSPQQHGSASATNPSSSYDHSIDDHDSSSSSSSSTSQANKDGTRIKSRRRQ
ncbi:hypothetical protein [Absidia glauca]|uniref:TMEM62 C-terminal domain-containing protein n=1 Tax=Absidia glauca TaxID=4829 RepID=A0A163JGL0_ABSGL|nr:hypothetical protein [Absidia glauca]